MTEPSPRLPTAGAADLQRLLRERFGLQAFRRHQEEVCAAVAGGESALVVMPTGSGKSLCYQLPGIARGGTTLVISPLIALMDDQTAKLRARGFRVEPIHSGRRREDLRAACRAYLDGHLDFLLIAPERLSVPGFPEMLAKRCPTLIAVDEAHCISHWGHDFRPDYRLLGDRLPLLRPAPVIALTATATLRVQQDIVTQLGIPEARRFIRGFRRENLAINLVELSKGDRTRMAVDLLADQAWRPAIVYVPTRKMAEEVAALLGRRYRTAAYHAGMESEARTAAQEAFLRGEAEVVVATIAFGMGVDKADVRSVIHLAMPGTVEAYYQEIGRAGRDGKPSRAVLLWSWGDRRMHEVFLERDYPATQVLRAVLHAVPATGITREELLSRTALGDAAEAALDKLWIHGGVTVDDDDVVRPGDRPWEASYEAIRQYRGEQLADMVRFAQGWGCRMVRLVKHFGDDADARPCGVCDACRPEEQVGRRMRPLTAGERARVARVLEALAERDGLSTGTLHRMSDEGATDRKAFERLLEGMARGGLIDLRDDAFQKDGQEIRFHRAYLQDPGTARSDALLIEDGSAPAAGRKGRKGKTPAVVPAVAAPARRRVTRGAAEVPARDDDAWAPPELVERLRLWRREAARARGVPAFRILTDRALLALAAERPATKAAMLQVPGFGRRVVEKHGTTLLDLIRRVAAGA